VVEAGGQEPRVDFEQGAARLIPESVAAK